MYSHGLCCCHQIERLKSQLTQQESSKRAQAEELERLQEQLEGLHKEEREYKEKVRPLLVGGA